MPACKYPEFLRFERVQRVLLAAVAAVRPLSSGPGGLPAAANFNPNGGGREWYSGWHDRGGAGRFMAQHWIGRHMAGRSTWFERRPT